MTLTHFNTNNWADAQGDLDDKKVAHHDGLTPFGKDVVREMNRLGMTVDISHTADKRFSTRSRPVRRRLLLRIPGAAPFRAIRAI